MARAIAIHRYTLRISIGNAAESDMLSLCLIFSSKSLMFIIVCFMVYTMVTAKSMPPHCKYKKIYSSALLFLLLFATPPLFLSFITKVAPTAKGLLPVSAIVVLSAASPARREHGAKSRMSKKAAPKARFGINFAPSACRDTNYTYIYYEYKANTRSAAHGLSW